MSRKGPVSASKMTSAMCFPMHLHMAERQNGLKVVWILFKALIPFMKAEILGLDHHLQVPVNHTGSKVSTYEFWRHIQIIETSLATVFFRYHPREKHIWETQHLLKAKLPKWHQTKFTELHHIPLPRSHPGSHWWWIMLKKFSLLIDIAMLIHIPLSPQPILQEGWRRERRFRKYLILVPISQYFD